MANISRRSSFGRVVVSRRGIRLCFYEIEVTRTDPLTLMTPATWPLSGHRAVVHIVVIGPEHAVLKTLASLLIAESASDRNLV
jgi:hypothetical protein